MGQQHEIKGYNVHCGETFLKYEVDSAGAGFLKKGCLVKVVDGLQEESDMQLDTTGLVGEKRLSFLNTNWFFLIFLFKYIYFRETLND